MNISILNQYKSECREALDCTANLGKCFEKVFMDTIINIKAAYDAKYGAPSAGAPKVFFKYFYVNTTTGEKSGEVLLEGKLA